MAIFNSYVSLPDGICLKVGRVPCHHAAGGILVPYHAAGQILRAPATTFLSSQHGDSQGQTVHVGGGLWWFNG